MYLSYWSRPYLVLNYTRNLIFELLENENIRYLWNIPHEHWLGYESP